MRRPGTGSCWCFEWMSADDSEMVVVEYELKLKLRLKEAARGVVEKRQQTKVRTMKLVS